MQHWCTIKREYINDNKLIKVGPFWILTVKPMEYKTTEKGDVYIKFNNKWYHSCGAYFNFTT